MPFWCKLKLFSIRDRFVPWLLTPVIFLFWPQGHFLTLEPLNSLPEPDLTNLKLSRLDRWQLVQWLHQDFWRRWHTEYLQTLQQRNKWTKDTHAIQPGMLVLIKNEQTHPLQWRLGRVAEIHPGHDGIFSSQKKKNFSQGLFQRPVVKFCPLPLH